MPIYLKAECETIKKEDGRQDVIVKAPLLSVKDKVSEAEWSRIKRKVCEKQFKDLKAKCSEEEWEQFVKDQTDETLKMDSRIQVRAKTVADARDRIANLCQKYGIHLEGLADMV